MTPILTILAAMAALAALTVVCVRSGRERWRTARGDYNICLVNKSDIEAIVRILDRGRLAESFVAGLVALEGRLLRLTGAAWSWKILNNAVLVALAAPLTLFSLAWLAGASGDFAGQTVYPDIVSNSERAGRLSAVVAFGGGLLIFGSRFELVIESLKRMFMASGARSAPRMARVGAGPLGILITFLLAALLALAFAGSAVIAIAAARNLSLAPPFTLALMLAIAFALRGVAVVVWAVVGAALVVWSMTGVDPSLPVSPTLLLGFWVGLSAPFAAGLYLAWSATLSLIGLMGHRLGGRVSPMLALFSTLAILGHVSGGVVVFTRGESAAFDALNGFLAAQGAPSLDWRGFLGEALAYPSFAPRAWLPLGMAACLALPAVLVLTYGLSALALTWLPDRKRALSLLRGNERLSPDQRSEIATRLARLDMWRAPARACLFLLVVAGAALVLPLATPATNTDLLATLDARHAPAAPATRD